MAPPLAVISLEFHKHFWHQKTRVPVLFYDFFNVILGLTVFVQLRLVTDRRTDGQTDRQIHDDSPYRAIIARMVK